MAKIKVEQLIELFKQSLSNLNCEEAEKIVHELKKNKDIKENWFELIGFKSVGQVFRRVGTWCPKARRNFESVLTKLVAEHGFDQRFVYIPKVVLNSDTIEITKIDSNKVLVRCKKDGYSDYEMVYDKSQKIYLFNKMEKETE